MSGRDLAGLRLDDAASPATVPLPKSRWKTRVLLPLVLLLLFAAVLIPAAWDAIAPRTDVTVTPVVVRKGAASVGSVAFQASGWFEPDPFPIIASIEADGIVREVLVLEGETVTKGQVLARLIDDDAKLAVRKAEAAVTQHHAHVKRQDARLAAAQADWDNPVERERAVDEAAGRVAAARASIERQTQMERMRKANETELAEQLRREEELLPSDAVSELDVIRTRQRLAAATASVAEAVAARRVAEGELQRAEADLVAARRDRELRIEETEALAAAKAALERAKGEHADVLARLDEAKLFLRRMEIRAPIDGVVMTLPIAPGAKRMMAMDDPHSNHIVELYDPERLQVRVDVPLADAAGLGVGQKAEIVAEVLPDRVFQVEVTRVVHQADIQKNTLQAKVRVLDPRGELRPEMLARVRFFGQVAAATDGPQESEQVFAPERLLQERAGESATVWIVDKGASEAVRRSVTVGSGKHDGWLEISAGLSPGDALIDPVPAGLEDGDTLNVTGEAR